MKITRRGVEMNTVGALPVVGSQAPALTNLVTKGWNKVQNAQELFKGKYIILNIFPSIDTPTCATTVRTFNKAAAQLKNAVVLCISKDLPPALTRFCAAEGIESVVPLSAYRSDCNFGDAYGIRITDGAGEDQAFKDLFGRGLVVMDPQGKVVYSELVTELAQEPNYTACLNAVGVDLKSNAEVQQVQSATVQPPSATTPKPTAGAAGAVAAVAPTTPLIFAANLAVEKLKAPENSTAAAVKLVQPEPAASGANNKPFA
jgi:thiol peroxidase